jgi:hypothetical protein
MQETGQGTQGSAQGSVHGSPKKASRYERPPLDAAVQVTKEWRVHDFLGRYHLSRVKNIAPVPGAALGIERAEKLAKEADAKRFEGQLEQRALQYKRTIRARVVGAAESTRLHIDAVIGSQIDATQRTMQGREAEKEKKNYFCDTAEQVKRFKKNVVMNRPHYVGYAVISVGFRSMVSSATAAATTHRMPYVALIP